MLLSIDLFKANESGKYTVVSDFHPYVYEFLSYCPKGTIRKVVYYQEIRENLFNLSFGDWDEDNERNNDNIRSNNLDRNKVLATVASTVIDFINNHPRAIILVKGSTNARTRLYQVEISANLIEITMLFNIYGFFINSWEPFEPGKNYVQFALRAK